MLDAPIPFQKNNETTWNYQMKLTIWEWLYTVAQCWCVGIEVRPEGLTSRLVDLMGVGPGNTIHVVEVKAISSGPPAHLQGLVSQS